MKLKKETSSIDQKSSELKMETVTKTVSTSYRVGNNSKQGSRCAKMSRNLRKRDEAEAIFERQLATERRLKNQERNREERALNQRLGRIAKRLEKAEQKKK